jgi:hypothetical protein
VTTSEWSSEAGPGRKKRPLPVVSSSGVPRTSPSEGVVTEEKSRGGHSRTHRQEVEVQSGRPEARQWSVAEVAGSLTAERAD